MATFHRFIFAFFFVIPSLVAYVHYGHKPFYANKELRIGIALQLLLFLVLFFYIIYTYIA